MEITMPRSRRWSLILFFALPAVMIAQDGSYSIKISAHSPPKEIDPAIAKLLSPDAIQLLNNQGKTVAELWFRREIPGEATAEQIKNGLTYRELKQTEVLGAVRFDQDWTDYRKQKIKSGVYTLRLGFQPQDGDHTGVSQFTEFLLLIAAGKDTRPDLMEPKDMIEASTKTMGTSHPGVLMLFPNNMPAGAPQLVSKENNHWVLNLKDDVAVNGKKMGSIGIGLALVGNAN
jgi:hypothetical protein